MKYLDIEKLLPVDKHFLLPNHDKYISYIYIHTYIHIYIYIYIYIYICIYIYIYILLVNGLPQLEILCPGEESNHWSDQRITDYPTAPQRRNRIISVYYDHSQLGPFNSTRAMFVYISVYMFYQRFIFVVAMIQCEMLS